MKEILFESNDHKEKCEVFLECVPAKNHSPENLAVVYLVAWVETVKPNVADQILDFQTCSINPLAYLKEWQTERTQNAIFLAHSLKTNNYDYALNIIDASNWDKCFVEAFCICCNTCYSEMKARWNELLKFDAERKNH